MSLRAVIDVGTNSVKILLARVHGRDVVPEWEASEQTRLGQGFYENHRLQPGPIAATAASVARFASAARGRGAESVRIIATSAAREAENAEELLGAIRAASGLATEVIPGALEAEWGFTGVTSNPDLADRRLLVLDVGGGSTEFIFGDHGHARFSESFPLGSVRLMERFRPKDSPDASELRAVRGWLRDFLGQQVCPRLQPHFGAAGAPGMAVGVGGTTSILALIRLATFDFDREQIEQTRFSAAEVRDLHERLWSLSLAERRKLPGMPPERADVILLGAAIYEAVLETLEIPTLGVSTRGLRFAALLDDAGRRWGEG